MNMKDEELLKKFSEDRNHSQSTKESYKRAFKQYLKLNKKTIQELLKEAEKEEENNIRWKKRKLKKRLTTFRRYLIDNYNISTTHIYLTAIKSFYLHHEIEIHNLPYISKKNVIETAPLMLKDLPDKEIIRKCLKITSPMMKAIILLITSSGMGRTEILNLTIKDFTEATKKYHQKSNNINKILNILNKTKEGIVPTWQIKRQKTNKYYYTFNTPESTIAILNYLKTRQDKLTLKKKLFNIHPRYLSMQFLKINNTLKLGKRGNYARFRPHMLRKFHASNLYRENGLSLDQIDALQGRSKTKTRSSYFMDNPELLRKQYIRCMKYITIDKAYHVQTKLDKEKQLRIKKENELQIQEKKHEEKMKNFKDDLKKELLEDIKKEMFNQ